MRRRILLTLQQPADAAPPPSPPARPEIGSPGQRAFAAVAAAAAAGNGRPLSTMPCIQPTPVSVGHGSGRVNRWVCRPIAAQSSDLEL